MVKHFRIESFSLVREPMDEQITVETQPDVHGWCIVLSVNDWIVNHESWIMSSDHDHDSWLMTQDSRLMTHDSWHDMTWPMNHESGIISISHVRMNQSCLFCLLFELMQCACRILNAEPSPFGWWWWNNIPEGSFFIVDGFVGWGTCGCHRQVRNQW